MCCNLDHDWASISESHLGCWYDTNDPGVVPDTLNDSAIEPAYAHSSPFHFHGSFNEPNHGNEVSIIRGRSVDNQGY